MADFEAKVGVNFDTSNAIAAIKQLQSQLSDLNRTLTQGSNINAAAAKNFQRNLIADINASGKFVARMQQIRSTTEQFTDALERNKLSMGQYFRYAASTTKTFGNKFTTEFKTIEKVARERVKSLQTQYIALGRDANGALQSIAVRPLKLDLDDLATKQAIVAQKQQIFNQLLKQGSTNLLNFGKNTQWAGRQLMVGFTIPLSIFGAQASKTFMTLEEQAIKFRRVYGELFTPPGEADKMLDSLKEIGTELTKYGVSLEDTLSLAGDVAAMGKTGADLLAQVEQATRLSVLGNVDQQKALEASISITNAFGIAAEDLADKINFLNAVENQTVLSIEDLTTAIPKAGPVVQQLGGSVEDLAFFMTAMKEGGINASEGANALKSGLAKIINPTEKASAMLKDLGININKIVEDNAGDIKTTILELSAGLDSLDPLNRARAIEELFGRFQFARISTLFQNIAREGTQASRVLDLTNSSLSDLANLSEKELGAVADSTTFEFRKAIEQFQIAIAPIGEQFLKAVTPIIEFATGIIKRFDSMSDGAKNFVVILTAILGAVAPVALMTFGLVANGVANLIKGFAAVRGVFLKTSQDSTVLGGQMEYLTQEQIQAGAVAASLEQSHQRLTQQFTAEASAVDMLAQSYGRAIVAGRGLISGGAIQTTLGQNAKRYASGGIVSGKGTGKSDSIMAMVSNGEAIIPADVVKKNPSFFESLIAGKIPGFSEGGIINLGGKSFEAPSQRSATAVDSLVSKLMAFGNELPQVVAVLEKLQASGEKLTAANVKAAARAEGLVMGRKGVVAGHTSRDIDPNSEVGRRAIEQAGYSNAPDFVKSRLRVVSNQTASMPSWLNNVMKPGARGATVDEFDRGFTNNKNKFADTLKAEGLDVNDDEVIKEMNELEREISELTKQLAKGGPITDDHLQDASEQVIKKYEQRGSKVGKALGNAGRTAGQVRLSYSQDEYRQMMDSGKFVQKPGTRELTTADGKYRVGRLDSEGSSFRPASSADMRGGYRGRKNKHSMFEMGVQDAKDYGNGVQKGKKKQGDQYKINQDRKSPHREAFPDGEQDAKAYAEGVESGTNKSKKRVRRATSAPQQPAGPRRASAPQQTASRDAALRAKAEREASAAAEKAATSNRRMTRASNGALYALTSLAGVASMAGGQIGEVAQTMFMITAGMTALNAVMGIFTEKTLIQLALDRFSMAQQALKDASTAGSIAATNGFTAALSRASIGLMAFVGGGAGLGILAATAAIAGLVGIVYLSHKAQEEQRKKLEALGVGAEMARGKLAEIASLYFGGKDVSPAETGSGLGKKGPSEAVLKRQEEIANNEQLLSQYEDQINKISILADQDIRGIVDQMAYTLTSYGIDKIDIEALLRAILEKAGKSDVEIDFDNISFSRNSRAIENSAKDLADKLRTSFENSASANTIRVAFTDVTTDGLTNEERAKETLLKLDKERAKLVSDTAVGLLGINAALERNGISATTAGAKAARFVDVFKGMDENLIKEMLPDLAEELGLDNPDFYKNVQDVTSALQVMTAQAMGMDVDSSLIDFMTSDANTGEVVRQKALAQKYFNAEYKKYLDGKEKEKELEAEQAKQDAAELELTALREAVEEAEGKKEAYDQLVEGGKEAAEAAKIVGDAMLYEAYTTALAAGRVEEFFILLDRLNAANIDVGGGSGGSTPFQDAMESLRSQRDDLRNTTAAYTKLRKAGFDISSSAKLAADSTLALALATTKVGTAKYKELLSIIKEIDVASRKNAIKDLVAERSADIQLKSQFLDSYDILVEMGYEAQDIMNILDNPDLAREFVDDLKDGKLDSKQLLNYLKQIESLKKLKVEIELSTPEGQWSEIDNQFGNVQNWFQTQKAAIDIKFRPTIEAQEDVIKKAQEEIEDFNNKVYENEYQLEGISLKEDAINKKYEERVKALDAIVNVNKVIQAQEKGALSVADALTQGDIAAAARAAQEARVATAAAIAEDNKQKLELAKEKELADVRSEDGRSRAEIEKQIQEYKTKISEIEHDRVKPAERLRDAAIDTRDAEKDSLKFLGLNETAWGDLETAAKKARVEAEAYKKAIEDAMLLLAQASDGKVGLPEGYTGSTGTKSSTKDAEIAELNRLIQITRDRVQKGDYTDAAQKQRLMQINIDRIKQLRELTGDKTTVGGLALGGLVPKYFAAGGFAMGTDTVPAMLTPGEFVMRRSAVRSFGLERLKAINSGTYAGNSMYNYEVNVNVKSDANPEQIASAVMSKIKGIESQRIRGGRI